MKRYIVEVPTYLPEQGLNFYWENNYSITTEHNKSEVRIIANEAGLRSLANHLLNLAQTSVPKGTHIHLDEFNSLEQNSIDIIIEKK